LSFDCVIDDTNSCQIVDMDGGGGLGMPPLLHGKSHHFCFLYVQKKRPELGFGCGSSDEVEHGAENTGGSIDFDWLSGPGDAAE
jgi:hypothetical protein